MQVQWVCWLFPARLFFDGVQSAFGDVAPMKSDGDFARLGRMLKMTMTARGAFHFIPPVFHQVLDHFVCCHVFRLKSLMLNGPSCAIEI